MDLKCYEETSIDFSKDRGHSVDDSVCTGEVESNEIKPQIDSKHELKVENIVALSNYNGCCSLTDLPRALVSEILKCFDPKELGIVSCVSTTLQTLAYEHHVWKQFYFDRWGLPSTHLDSQERSWKDLYVARDFRSKIFMGRYTIDVLNAHTEPVRTVYLLASANLIFTSGYDSIVRMWNMEEGRYIASSKRLGCTIRAVTADTKLLIAGGTDGFIHFWRAMDGLPNLFDLKQDNTKFRLWEHEGPITCLALNLSKIYSGSWDMKVRIWDRNTLKCLQVLKHNDWVYSLSPHGNTVATTAGSDLYIWDTESGTQLNVLENAHNGNTYSLARSHTGNFIFTGGEDGAIHMFEIHHKNAFSQVTTWIPHNGPVHSLAFEFPWLVSASSDGNLSLIDVRKLLKNRKKSKQIEPPQRMLHGFGCNLFAVDIGADRIVCGGEEGNVRIWNFSQALAKESEIRALRGIRLENRMRRRRIQDEMNSRNSRGDQCSVSANKNPRNGDENIVWNNKRGGTCKLKA